MKNVSSSIQNHSVVSHEDWLVARTAFLAKEKEFTRVRDELSRARRALPWEKVEKTYAFNGPKGQETLAQLFENCSQLIVYHFMFAPEWEAGCKHCSFWADNFNDISVHLKHRDAAFVAISRAPLEKIESFRRRMGWTFKWVSSSQNDFNYDLYVSFRPEETNSGAVFYNYVKAPMNMSDREGVSVFYKDSNGSIFHTYSTYARGLDMLNTAYNYLDLTPKGRDEDTLSFSQAWVQYHDRYPD